jgi:hypothetical protein
MKKLDKIGWGAFLGILLPAVALYIFYKIRYENLGISEFLKSFHEMGILTHVISLSVIPNLILFFLFMHKNYLKGGRGVLLATFLFAFLVLIIRFT